MANENRTAYSCESSKNRSKACSPECVIFLFIGQQCLIEKWYDSTISSEREVLNLIHRNHFNKYSNGTWQKGCVHMYIFLLFIVCMAFHISNYYTHFNGQHRRKSSVFIGIIKFVYLFSNIIGKTKQTINFNLNTYIFSLFFLFQWPTTSC